MAQMTARHETSEVETSTPQTLMCEKSTSVVATGPGPAAGLAQNGAQHPTGIDFAGTVATFQFEGEVNGYAYPSLSPDQQEKFKIAFCNEAASLKRWSVAVDWPPASLPPGLKVFVSDEYKISRALVPAATGQRGHMEFPAWRIVAGDAAILHELVHVFFPNGNRLLAEGLAVFLQAEIGANPAFPNFGIPLHRLAAEVMRKMVPEFAAGNLECLDKISIANLDKIATPSGLRLRVGRNHYQIDSTGHSHLYPIAGSFVQFLIETAGTDKLRFLYARTPLVPFQRNAGSPDRWTEVYGASLGDLERKWKMRVSEQSTPA
jgi:hypothetical protein